MLRLGTALFASLALTATATAQPLNLQYGGGPAKVPRETAARKAVAGMVAEKFPFAEITADGNARGWNDKCAVLVLCMPTPDSEQSQIFIVAACGDAVMAGRVRDTVRTQVFEGKDDPKTPKRIAPADGKVPPAPISFFVKSEDRTGTPLLKHFGPVASLVMEKMGMASKPEAPILVLGSGPSALSLVLVGPTANALNVKFTAVTITHGDKPAEKLAADILSRVVKILYE